MDAGADLVGVVGDPPSGLEASITDRGGGYRDGDVDAVLAADPDLLVAVGEAAALSVAREGPDAPVLAVDAGRGFRSVPLDAVTDAIDHVLGEEGTIESNPVLRVERDGDVVGRAVADVTLLSAEVAHISEFRVTAGESDVSQVRADGVVVATSIGSVGYARRIGGPVVAGETGVGAVVPIAPFATDPDHWVVPLDDVGLTVERDETMVTLLADDREVASVRTEEPVRITTDGSVDLVVTPESRPRFS